jgi:hypothetical protein
MNADLGPEQHLVNIPQYAMPVQGLGFRVIAAGKCSRNFMAQAN